MSTTLESLLDASDAEASDETETPEAEAPAEAEAPEPAAPEPAAEAPAGADDEALFSDEALATPAGVAAARDALRARRKAFARERDSKFLELRARTERAKARDAKATELVKSVEQREARVNRLVAGDVSPSEALEILAQVSGKDAIKVLESINLAAAGKRPPDAAVKKLEAEIAEMRRERETERETAKQRQDRESEAQLVQRRTAEMLELAQTVPHAKLLIEHSPAEAGERLVRIKIEAHEAGKPITDQEAVERLEAYLAKVANLYAAPGQVTGAGNAAKPGSAKQKTLTSAQVAAEGSTRQLTEDEYLEANAESILQDLFG